MRMDRVILHCDLNNFYASVEQKAHPEYDGMPLAVCGNPEVRHGIVLAKNMLAKAAGVQTGEAIWISRKKCPGIVFVPPHYDEYVRYSKEVFDIYTEFTDRVESFGLDECWLDVTGSLRLFGCDGKALADRRWASPSPKCWQSWGATSKNPTPPSCSPAKVIWTSSGICPLPS